MLNDVSGMKGCKESGRDCICQIRWAAGDAGPRSYGLECLVCSISARKQFGARARLVGRRRGTRPRLTPNDEPETAGDALQMTAVERTWHT